MGALTDAVTPLKARPDKGVWGFAHGPHIWGYKGDLLSQLSVQVGSAIRPMKDYQCFLGVQYSVYNIILALQGA